ncbi:MAG: YncE family protein [Acidobacteria bacterium]|nr:YncE family protein [Acidobacteriota bacterium]
MKKTRRALYFAALFFSLLLGAGFAARAQNEKASAAAVAQPTPSAGTNAPQKVIREGVEVEFTIEPVASSDMSRLTAGEDALVRFRVTDTATKNPVTGVKPSAWINQNTGEDTGDPRVCREKVSGYLQGTLRSRADLDLNTFYVLALNQEANISVINPLVGFGGSKLLTLIMLKSSGEDWALTSDQERLFVSLPLAGQVAVVDTATWKVTGYIEAGARPTRLALQPDGKYLWVADDAEGERAGGVTVIDTATLKPAATIATGAGHHELAFSDDSRFAFVTNRRDGTLSVVEVSKLSKLRDVKAGAAPTSLAFSPLSKAVYVASETDGAITVVDGRTHAVLETIAARPGLHTLRIEPKGRYGFVTNSTENVVHIFDASTNRFVHTLQAGKAPDQLSFSDAFAYVRSAGTEDVTMIRLSTIGKDPDVRHFPGGQSAPGKASSPSLADSFFPAPGGDSMLVANAPDGVIYYYTEGMAAPLGNFQNYRREPKAVRVVDRSLREVAPGVYKTNVKLPEGGKLDVALLIDSPRIAHCFSVSAKPNPAARKAANRGAVKVEYLVKDRGVRAGEPFKLRFKLTDEATGQPKNNLKDVRVLTFLAPGIWQSRDFAQALGDGVYELGVTVPEEGFYMVFVESRALGVGFRDVPYLTLQATSPAAADASTKPADEKP